MSKRTLQICLAAAILTAAVGYYVFSHMKQGGNPFSGLRRQSTKVDFGIPYARFKDAETLRSARSEELVTEVKAVIRQEGLPADVFVDDKTQTNNIAVTLYNLFFQFYDPQNPDDTLEKLWEASPIGVWNISEQTLDSVRTEIEKLEPIRQAIRTMLLQSDTRFYYIFVYPESLKTGQDVGTKINTDASGYLSDYALLEEYAIARALHEGDLTEATNALSYIFRITKLASHIGNVGARSDAAQTRLRTYDIMQQVILDPKFDRNQMLFLQKMLQAQYDDWPSEYRTWFGDRASGIIVYHRLMLYESSEVLEEAEYNDLLNRTDLRTFSRGFLKYREADQAFYLRSMQSILDISEEPLSKRWNVLDQINGELFRKEGLRDEQGIAMEPFVAHILLKDVDKLMRLFARDRSALNRALVLMRSSLGQSNTDRFRDPFTDAPYEIQKVDGFHSITTSTLQNPFRVPIFVEQ